MPTAKKAEKASAAKKPAAKKAPAKATSPAKKSSAAKKTTAKKAPASKAAPAKQASATKQATPAKRTATKKAPAKQPTSDEKPATKKAPAKQAPAKQAAADTAPRGLDPNRKPASKPSEFPVRQGEDKWTRAELDEVRNDLEAEVVKHRRSIELAEAELQELLADGADGAGRDAADVGSANFERDQEMSLAAAAREMLTQTEHALRLIDQGLYGWCESCGEPIGKGRLQVYPRATMCVVCKQRHERR